MLYASFHKIGRKTFLQIGRKLTMKTIFPRKTVNKMYMSKTSRTKLEKTLMLWGAFQYCTGVHH